MKHQPIESRVATKGIQYQIQSKFQLKVQFEFGTANDLKALAAHDLFMCTFV